MTWFRCGGGNSAILKEEQITDISGFTKITNTSLAYGSTGMKVISNLSIVDENTIYAHMANGWSDSNSAFYESENLIGAYGGYEFNEKISSLSKVKFWFGRYSGQNKTLIATVQYLDGDGNWQDIDDVDITTSIPYPINTVEVTINQPNCYGIRWIHKKGENKTSGNNICFFGMALYELRRF